MFRYNSKGVHVAREEAESDSVGLTVMQHTTRWSQRFPRSVSNTSFSVPSTTCFSFQNVHKMHQYGIMSQKQMIDIR